MTIYAPVSRLSTQWSPIIRDGRRAITVAVGALMLPMLTFASPLTAPADAAPTGVSPVAISEVESGDGDPGDWVELTNTGDEPVDISGWMLKDDKDDRDWRIPEETVIEPGEHLVLDEESEQTPEGFDFGLGKADQVRLFLADGTTLVDEIAWDGHAATTLSVCGDEVYTTNPITRGAANDCTPPDEGEDPEEPADPVEPAPTGVVINEAVSSGGDPDDWAELTNTTDAPVDVSGWYLLDDDDDAKDPSVIEDGTVIEPGQYLVIERDELGFGLGKGDQARLFTPDGTLVDLADWEDGTHAEPSLARCPDGTGEFEISAAATKGAPNNCAAPLVVSEINSKGDDFVELRNDDDQAVDASGYVVKDDDDDHAYNIPEGTELAAGEHLLITGDQLGFGLGGSDAVRLFAPDGAQIGSVEWTEHVRPSLGLCESEYVAQAAATPGEANDCVLPEPARPLPTTGDVLIADDDAEWPEDLSGLDLQVTDGGEQILWASNNDAGQISRLVRADDGTWAQSEGWPTGGKPSRFPDGTGVPDAEGISAADSGRLYVAVERDNDNGGTSRNSVLRFDPKAADEELIADAEWNLTDLLPSTGANAGLEAIEVVPASAMTSLGAVPEGAEAYAFVALEATGDVYAVALMPDGSAQLIATIDTPLEGVMALDYDPGLNRLWAFCDEACDGESVQFDLGASEVVASERISRAEGLPNLAHEGVAIAPASTCQNGTIEAWFADDANTDGHSLRGVRLTGYQCESSEEPGDGQTSSDDEQPDDDEQPENEAPGDHEQPSADVEAPGEAGTPQAPEESGQTAAQEQEHGDSLARTGTEAQSLAALAAGLLVGGAWLMRRSHLNQDCWKAAFTRSR